MVCSIRKGKSFERTVAHALTKITGVPWKRVPCSGGFATAEKVEDHRFRGDVFTEDEKYANLCVECKISGEKFTLATLFSDDSPIWKWWMQVCEEGGGAVPVLIFKYRNSPVFFMCRYRNGYNLLSGVKKFAILMEDGVSDEIYLGVLK